MQTLKLTEKEKQALAVAVDQSVRMNQLKFGRDNEILVQTLEKIMEKLKKEQK
jgi:hypothetical protein